MCVPAPCARIRVLREPSILLNSAGKGVDCRTGGMRMEELSKLVLING